MLVERLNILLERLFMPKQNEYNEPEESANDPLDRGSICEDFPSMPKIKSRIINEKKEK